MIDSEFVIHTIKLQTMKHTAAIAHAQNDITASHASTCLFWRVCFFYEHAYIFRLFAKDIRVEEWHDEFVE